MSPPAKKEEKKDPPPPKTAWDFATSGNFALVVGVVALLMLADINRDNMARRAGQPVTVAGPGYAVAPSLPVAPAQPVAASLPPGGTVVIPVPSTATTPAFVADAPQAVSEGEPFRCDESGAPANPGTGWCRR